MEDAASQIAANPGAAPAWIGLYPVERIRPIRERVSVSDLGLRLPGPCLASPTRAGEPPRIGEDRYEFIGDGWWHWTESW